MLSSHVQGPRFNSQHYQKNRKGEKYLRQKKIVTLKICGRFEDPRECQTLQVSESLVICAMVVGCAIEEPTDRGPA